MCSFTTIGKTLKNDIPNTIRPNIEIFLLSLYLKSVNTVEVLNIINNSDNKFSSGDEYISNTIVKTSATFVALYLAFKINLSFLKDVFPKELQIKGFSSTQRVIENG